MSKGRRRSFCGNRAERLRVFFCGRARVLRARMQGALWRPVLNGAQASFDWRIAANKARVRLLKGVLWHGVRGFHFS